MSQNINVSNIFKSSKTTVETNNANQVGPTNPIQKSTWITDEQIMKTIGTITNGIIAVYQYYFEDERYKDFRIFYDYQDMIRTMSSEIYTLYSKESLNIQDSINGIIFENDHIIIPKQKEGNDITIKIMNSFMTNEVFVAIKQELNKMNIQEDKSYVRITNINTQH